METDKPAYMPVPESRPPQPMDAGKPRHRRWIVHSHEATRPAHTEAKSDINITPLIDVLLVLLIIFMVVTPLAQKGLDIALPQTDTRPPDARPKDTNQVVLTLEQSTEGGSVISVNKNPVATMEELDQRLRDIFQARSDKTIFVKAAGKVPYGRVVQAMDIARGAGVERIGIISEEMALETAGATGQ